MEGAQQDAGINFYGDMGWCNKSLDIDGNQEDMSHMRGHDFLDNLPEECRGKQKKGPHQEHAKDV